MALAVPFFIFLLTDSAAAQERNEVTPSVVITGSVTQRAAEEAPFAITQVGRDALRNAGPMVNLSEALAVVPGLVVSNRANYAQDLQISSRGFGARAGFGVRGLRLYADGIPATGPDGQGQVSHVDIAGAQRVEVLRGPFSVLYGNSSGGVIAVFGAPAKAREVEASLDGGSFGLVQGRLSLAMPLDDGFDLRASASTLRTAGFRPHAGAQKTQGNVRLGWQSTHDTVTLTLNHLDQPADDPLGLTRAQFDLGPEQTAQVATDFDTGKNTRQTQAGIRWRHRVGEGPLRDIQVVAFGGQRNVAQWLAITPATQSNPRHGGGVIALDRLYNGVDARARWALGPLDLVTGAALEHQRDARKGYENFTGTGLAQVVGVTGRLRRDEINTAQTQDVYAQADLALPANWQLVGGARSGRVVLQAHDAYLSNGDDSGDLAFRYTNPVLGLRWKPARALNLYASVARGFESPTLGELAYRADGTGGFNTALKPQTSRQAELGAKWREGGMALDLTLFDVATTDEIGVATNAGGRSAFQNVGRTARRGVEAGLTWRPAGDWNAFQLQLSGSALKATYEDTFLVCAGIPCNAPTLPVAPGNRIAGAPSGNAYAELAWAGGPWGEWAVEVRGMGSQAVNDRNTDFAAGYATGAIRWATRMNLPAAGLRLEWLVRVDNLANRRYGASVIVNDANGRSFEPGAPRSVLVSLRLQGIP